MTMHGQTEVVFCVLGLLLLLAAAHADYIEFHAGDGGLPVVISAPHGGNQAPSTIPNRGRGCYSGGRCVWRHGCRTSSRCKSTTVMDMYTKQLALELRTELHNLTGHWAPAIANNLHRRKLDPNRARGEAAFGVPLAETAFDEYKQYIQSAKSSLRSARALFLDIHGHAHTKQRAELGYLISRSNLNANNMNADTTSIRSLFNHQSCNTIETLVRGRVSFGAYLEAEGYSAVPSPTNPRPNSDSYFSGGELTKVEGSRNGGLIDAIQIESPRSFRVPDGRGSYVKALAKAVVRFLQAHYNYE